MHHFAISYFLHRRVFRLRLHTCAFWWGYEWITMKAKNRSFSCNICNKIYSLKRKGNLILFEQLFWMKWLFIFIYWKLHQQCNQNSITCIEAKMGQLNVSICLVVYRHFFLLLPLFLMQGRNSNEKLHFLSENWEEIEKNQMESKENRKQNEGCDFRGNFLVCKIRSNLPPKHSLQWNFSPWYFH